MPSITLAELGVSNHDHYPDKKEQDDSPPATPSTKNLVDALAGVFFASSKLGTGTKQKSDIKLNHYSKSMLIYSNFSKGVIDDAQLRTLEDFEQPFEKFTGPLSALPEDFKIALCQRLYYVSKHMCDHCSNAQMQE